MINSLPKGVKVKGVGHRIVHGGQEFVKPTLLNKDIIAKMQAITNLAPLHMPANLAGGLFNRIKSCLKKCLRLRFTNDFQTDF